MTVTRELAEYVLGLDAAAVPAASLDHAKQAVLDLIGIALRATAETPTSAAVRSAVAQLDGGGACTAVGYAGGFSPQYAALLNGCNFHVLDFDDTHEASSLHPGAPVIGAALAAAEEHRSSGRDFLAAVVAGYDVTVRVGLAAAPAAHYARGFHPTATAGHFGATAALARLAGFDAGTLVSAFGINLSQAAGSLQFTVDGAQTKPLQVGLAAHNAVLAQRFAAAGVRGPAEALEGRSGFLHAYTEGARPQDVLETWDGVHEIERTAFKPYPCCRYIHAAIDQLAAIVREHRVRPESVERIRIGLPEAGIRLTARPSERKRRPVSVVDAQFSSYYAAAATVLWGSVRWDDYARRAAPEVAALTARVEVEPDPEIEALAPRMAAKVELVAGPVRERRIARSPRGEPDAPLGWDELIAKFDDLAGAALDAQRRARIVALVRKLDTLGDVSELTRELRVART